MKQTAFAILVFFECINAFAADGQAIDGGELSVIRAALSEYHDGIYSLEARYKVQAYEGPPGDEHRGNVAFSSEWKWLLRGQRMLLEKTEHRISGEPSEHLLWSFDGAQSWQIVYDLGGISTKQVSWKNDRPTRPWDEAVTLADFVGWKIVGLHESVLDLLPAKLDQGAEYHEIMGHKCLRLQLHRWSFFEGGPPHVLIVWFDPAFDWMPRQIQVMPEAGWKSICGQGDPPKFEVGFQFHNFVVDEFRAFKPANDGKPFWFPWKAMSNGGGMTELQFQVESISVNPEIPVALFTPDIPDGSRLFENYGTANQRIVDPTAEQVDSIPVPDPAFSAPSPGSRAISARIPTGSLLKRLILSGSVVLLIAGVVLKLRSIWSRA